MDLLLELLLELLMVLLLVLLYVFAMEHGTCYWLLVNVGTEQVMRKEGPSTEPRCRQRREGPLGN